MHTLEAGHKFAWDKTRIVDSCPHKKGREFLEAIHSDDSCINRRIDLDAMYINLKEKWKRGVISRGTPAQKDTLHTSQSPYTGIP
ncbi:hypothetical protein SprV_0902725800 [Sparganum proliferum]